jgi:hypothetical protein
MEMTRMSGTRSVCAALLLVLAGGPITNATSIVIAFQSDRILVLADSRVVRMNQTGNQSSDDMCKLMILGEKFAFAETGEEGYTRAGPNDPVPEWNGKSEASKAYEAHVRGGLYDVALRWAIQVANNFERFYAANPAKVRLLAASQRGTLLEGFFVGTDTTHSLRIYMARIALDDTLRIREGAPVPIGYSLDSLPPRSEAYSTDTITKELLDGKTERAKGAAKLWERKAHRFPAPEQEFRRLEFLIEQTGSYNLAVHKPVNALQVTREKATWIQNETCKHLHD